MIKAYTDLEQSRKLAEFLPLDSADIEYILEHWIDEITGRYKEAYCEIPVVKVEDDCPLQPITHPCWSLAALLEIINKCCRYGVRLKFLRSTFDGFGNVLKNVWCITTDTSETEPFIDVVYADNALDAAVNIILKLHEKNILQL